MGPETTAPPSPPGRVGRQLGWGTGSWPSHARLGINCSRPSGRRASGPRRLGPQRLRSAARYSFANRVSRKEKRGRAVSADWPRKRRGTGACGGGRGWVRACGSARAGPPGSSPPRLHPSPPLSLPALRCLSTLAAKVLMSGAAAGARMGGRASSGIPAPESSSCYSGNRASNPQEGRGAELITVSGSRLPSGLTPSPFLCGSAARCSPGPRALCVSRTWRPALFDLRRGLPAPTLPCQLPS